MSQQLTLIPEAKPAAPPDHMAPEQRANFERICQELRAERDELLAIANEFSPSHKYEQLADLPRDLLQDAKAEYNERHNLPAPFWVDPNLQPLRKVTPKPFRPLRVWTKERKWRRRLADLNKRVRKTYSFPDLICNMLQEELLLRPDYYGVCPLPGSVDACPIQLPDLKQLAAIERENQFRMIEAGILQPLEPLPLVLKEKEVELVEILATSETVSEVHRR